MQYIFAQRSKYFLLLCLISLISFTTFAQVGINTTEPLTTLDVNGALSLRESDSPLTLGSNNKDIDLGANPYSQYRIEGPQTAFTIDGIKKVNELADGQIVRLINTTDKVMTIVHNDTGGDFKILCPSDQNLLLAGRNSSVTLQYSKQLVKWTVSGYAINSSSKYSVFANTFVTKNDGNAQDLAGLSITFTPTNSIVYVTYNVYGDINPGDAEGRFHLLMNGDLVNNTEMRTGSLGKQAAYQAMLPMFPLRVAPGIPVTLKVQWWRGSGSGTINNNPYYPSHGRYLTIID